MEEEAEEEDTVRHAVGLCKRQLDEGGTRVGPEKKEESSGGNKSKGISDKWREGHYEKFITDCGLDKWEGRAAGVDEEYEPPSGRPPE